MEFAFVSTPGRRWLWEAFKHPWCAATFADQRAFARVERVVPDANELCRFVVEDDGDRFLVHDCALRVAVSVIGDCFAFEYYLVDPGLRWLVCENQHDTLFAVGDEVIPKLETVAADDGVAVILSEATDA